MPGESPEEHAAHAPEEAVMPASATQMCRWINGKCTLSLPFLAAQVNAPEAWAKCTEKNVVNAPHGKGWDCGTLLQVLCTLGTGKYSNTSTKFLG
jgi:hypothetical protein